MDWVFFDAGELLARTVAVTLALLLTTGNLVARLPVSSFAFGPLLGPLLALTVLGVVVSSLAAPLLATPLLRVVVRLEIAERAFVATLLIPVLIDRGVSTLRLFLRREGGSSAVLLRFAPAFALAVRAVVLFGLESFTRCSFGRGPRTPRQFSEPHRHSWTFFCEYGL